MSAPFATVPGARRDHYDRPVQSCADLFRYLRDPAFKAEIDAEVAATRASINAVFDERRRAQQEAIWAADERAPSGQALALRVEPLSGVSPVPASILRATSFGDE